MGDQMKSNPESAQAGALEPGALQTYDEAWNDIFCAFIRLLGDMAFTLKEPRTMTLDLPRLRSLPGWNR